MTVCPIAIAVTCKKCPAYSFCPAKSILGDEKPGNDKTQDNKSSAGTNKKS
ncbi:MAG: hypothetical protein QE278_09425 [Limnobacter sp.]|nr:hypothetical protein [Limnobacter sp.]